MDLAWLNPNWHEAGHFPPTVLFESDFWQLNFYQKFPNFLELKIETNRVNFDSLPSSLSLKKMPLGEAKDEHFFAFIAHAN